MRPILTGILVVAAIASGEPVRHWQGTITIPTYEHSGREAEPPLFGNSTLTGLYPFTTYIMPFTADSPKPHTYPAIFLENEYLKLTYIPEFGGRIFSLYDKLRQREVFYRNDVIKPTPYNPRFSWPQSGLELTGPYDVHMLTLHGEPFWANQIVEHADGSVSLVLGEIDPVYGMKVNLSGTLHPGVAALEIGVSCYNGRDSRMPQMLWINTAISATPKTPFVYPMSRTVGHTTADIADWPIYNGVDLSWDRNNKHMLGVFGIDIYDNFQGAYQFDRDYGIFRYADRRIVQGMKMWTFGYGEGAKNHERGYTDKAGPYVELQSGRHVWDGHYEWVAPHTTESWTEWWIPIAETGGLTTLSRDVALKLNTDSKPGTVDVAIAATRVLPGATVEVSTGAPDPFRRTIGLKPDQVFRTAAAKPSVPKVSVTVRDNAGNILLQYATPEGNPGRKEYTPFTRPLDLPRKTPEQMSAEELAIAAEFKLKELDSGGARALLQRALEKDAGYSRAHLLLGIDDVRSGSAIDAIPHLEKAIERDPYSDIAYYYLAIAQFAAGREREAERNLYFIWPDSAHFGAREYQLGRLAMVRGEYESAVSLFQRALDSNAGDLLARQSLAVAHRLQGDAKAALADLAALESADPTSRVAGTERWLLTGEAGSKENAIRLLGGQSQEAITVSWFYRNLHRWDEAVRVLRLAQEKNGDPWGTPPEFWYTLAYCQDRAGDGPGAVGSRRRARAAVANIDRFPYRVEAEPVLRAAIEADASDSVARFALGCLLYFHHRPSEAITQWETALQTAPKDFSVRRALGLAYAETGVGLDKAAAQLEQAVEINPTHVRTRNDLSNLYARAGLFDKQLAVLQKALAASPGDDDLTEAVFTASLLTGRYADAEWMILDHKFAVRHRSYWLRDKYRLMRYGMAAQAFHRGNYEEALQQLDAAANPPESLGVDDFAAQSSPRQQFYRGMVLERAGRHEKAQKAFEAATAGVDQLSGDRDSWNAENFFVVPALDRLGRAEQASTLKKRFENFAESEANSHNAGYRARASYLLALVRSYEGQPQVARELIRGALDAEPDYLPARLDQRGDAMPMKDGSR